MSDVSMVFFSSARCDLATAAAALARAKLVVHQVGPTELAVQWPNPPGPTLHVHFRREPRVRTEGHQIAAPTPYAATMASCDARFEIVIEDLAGTLDEMNTLLETQMTLQDLTGGLLFNTWTGKLSAPA